MYIYIKIDAVLERAIEEKPKKREMKNFSRDRFK